MKLILALVLGLLTFSNLLAMLFGEDLDCEECLKELDV